VELCVCIDWDNCVPGLSLLVHCFDITLPENLASELSVRFVSYMSPTINVGEKILSTKSAQKIKFFRIFSGSLKKTTVSILYRDFL